MKKFKEWLQVREMGYGSAVYDPKMKHPDFQWAGAPESMIKPKKPRKRKKK